MKRITAALSAVICVFAVTAHAAEYVITYYNADGELMYTKSLDRPSDVEIGEYADHYATEEAKTVKIL